MSGPAIGGPPGYTPPNPMNPGDPNKKDDDEEKPDGTVTLTPEDRLLVCGLELTLPKEHYVATMDGLEVWFATLRSSADLANPHSWAHELADVTQAYLNARGAFPQGALPRPADSARRIPYRPDERLSWVAALLPFLGEEYRDWRLNPAQSWSEGRNLLVAQRVIPHLIGTRQSSPVATHVAYPKVDGLVGATTFVGIAGVGLDAAESGASDSKRGVFGYDRVTRKEDIKDGLDQTIALIMAPSAQAGPWLAGGGSTVRGVYDESDEVHPVTPFVCMTFQAKGGAESPFNGKPGTLAIMADGKVRFIPQSIPAKTFRALCTIAGNDKVTKLDETCPVIESDKRQLSTGGVRLPTTGVPDAPAPKMPTSAVSGWETMTNDKVGFSVLMPGKPKESSVGAATVYEAKKGDGVFVVAVAENADLSKPGMADAALKRMGELAASKGKPVEDRTFTGSGVKAREFRFEAASPGAKAAKVRLYVIGNFIVNLTSEAKSAEDTKTFFDSFTITAGKTPKQPKVKKPATPKQPRGQTKPANPNAGKPPVLPRNPNPPRRGRGR